MVPTKLKPIIDTQKIKKAKHTTTENHQITKEKSKERKGKRINKQPQQINKMTISTYLSINTLNEKRLNYPIKRQESLKR